MTRSRKIALVAIALVAACVGVVFAIVPVVRRHLALRRTIAQVAEASDFAAVGRALAALDGEFTEGEIRLHLPTLLDALEACLERATRGPTLERRLWDEPPLGRILRRIAVDDPLRLAGALDREHLGPFAFRALLSAGRADVACPAPRDLTLLSRLAYHDMVSATASFEWGTHGSTAVTDGEWDLLLERSRDDDVFTTDLGARDRSSLADLGAVPLDRASAPAADDPRWASFWRLPLRDWSLPAVAGHTYAVHTRRPDVDIVTLFEVLARAPGDRVKIRWRVVEARCVEPP